MRVYLENTDHPDNIKKEHGRNVGELQYAPADRRTHAAERTGALTTVRGYGIRLGNHGITWEEKGAGHTEPGYGEPESSEQKRDYMLLMAHTVSEQDYKKMAEEGFEPGTLTPKETVTIVDRIKLDMVRGGTYIEGYTDSLSSEKLEAALGDEGLALEIERGLQEADLPCTAENKEAVRQAVTMAMSLREPEAQEKAYLIRNGEEPRIESLYRMENNGSKQGERRLPTYYAEEVEGYFSKRAFTDPGELSQAEMGQDRSRRLEKTLEEMGLAAEEETLRAAEWLMDQGIEVDAKTLEQYGKLESIRFPVSRQDGIRAAVYALAEGRRASQGDLSQNASLYRKAVELESTRLYMTAEVNLHLLRQGISLDTLAVEDRLRALEQGERELALIYFEGETQEGAVSKYRCMGMTLETISAVRKLPENVLAVGGQALRRETLPELRRHGEDLAAEYARAGAEYEKLMTVPVKALGDMPEKAFGDLDRLLEQVGWEVTEDNRRSMRILVHSNLELSEETLLAVHEARELTASVIDRMTPAAVLKMIRDGVNPLEESMADLESYLERQDEIYRASDEGYGAFLSALERQGNISPRERSAYIGIYRMLYQLEKGDKAAIGAVAEQKSRVGFQSLLRAMRTEKTGGLDVRVGEGLPVYGRRETDTESISEQIEAAFPVNPMAYREEEVLNLLARAGERETGYAIWAAWGLLTDPFGEGESRKRIGGLAELLGEPDFEEEYAKTLEDGIKAVGRQMELEELSALELGRLRACGRQLGLAKGLGEKQEYFIPMAAEGGSMGVHLCIQQAPGERSRVSVALRREEGEGLRGLSAEIELREGAVWAGFQGNKGESIRKLEEIADIFKEKAKKRWRIGAVVIHREGRARDRDYWTSKTGESDKASGRELYEAARLFLQAVQSVERRDREDVDI